MCRRNILLVEILVVLLCAGYYRGGGSGSCWCGVWLLLLCLVVMIIGWSQEPLLHWFVKKSSHQVGFFHISDIHMDPLYQPTWSSEQGWSCRRCPENNDCNQETPVWEMLTNQSALAYPFGRVGCDSSIFLVESMLQTMKSINSRPSFVLFTGDLVGKWKRAQFVGK